MTVGEGPNAASVSDRELTELCDVLDRRGDRLHIIRRIVEQERRYADDCGDLVEARAIRRFAAMVTAALNCTPPPTRASLDRTRPSTSAVAGSPRPATVGLAPAR